LQLGVVDYILDVLNSFRMHVLEDGIVKFFLVKVTLGSFVDELGGSHLPEDAALGSVGFGSFGLYHCFGY